MLDRRTANFATAVWTAAQRVGMSAPRIADEIIRVLFPRTCAEAEHEGAFGMLRDGVKSAAADVLKKTAPDDAQGDFAEMCSGFEQYVRPLKSNVYFVESLGEFVTVSELIKNPDQLDDARRYMRRKGMENLKEASRLDALYRAVMDANG